MADLSEKALDEVKDLQSNVALNLLSDFQKQGKISNEKY